MLLSWTAAPSSKSSLRSMLLYRGYAVDHERLADRSDGRASSAAVARDDAPDYVGIRVVVELRGKAVDLDDEFAFASSGCATKQAKGGKIFLSGGSDSRRRRPRTRSPADGISRRISSRAAATTLFHAGPACVCLETMMQIAGPPRRRATGGPENDAADTEQKDTAEADHKYLLSTGAANGAFIV